MEMMDEHQDENQVDHQPQGQLDPEPPIVLLRHNSNDRRRDSNRNSSPGGPNRAVQINMNCANRENDINKDLVFSPYYYITRYGRTLKRSEVLGFGFISLIVMSIALLAQLGLEALGFLEPSDSTYAHPPHTFSWKILTEFYMSDSLSNVDKDCLFFNKKRFLFQRDEDPETYLERLSSQIAEETYAMESMGNVTIDGILPHVQKCKYTRISNGWNWFIKYIYSMFFSFLSIFCSLIFLSCIQCRRKKFLQFSLLVPSFICFFLDIFQQIPITFHFNYANMVLMEDMQNALALTMPPILISPIWEETQIHKQCCGVQSPSTWAVEGYEGFPRSCCNTTAFACPKDSFPSRSEVWSTGCYQKEYDRLRHFEGYALLLLFLKLFAEIGLFWTLSDLTRYDYPPKEHVRTSLCHVKGYEITTKGCVTILGVTERQKAAIKLKTFFPGRYHLIVNQTLAGKTITIRAAEKLVGTVEIRGQRQPGQERNDQQDPSVDLDRGRNRGLIFVSF